MESTGSGYTLSSTYGQACMQCYKAKSRCVPRASGDTCERCFRLKKECQPSKSVRRRNAPKPEESDARMAQLEGKLESLLSIIHSTTNSSGSSTDILRVLNRRKSFPSASGAVNTPPDSMSTNPDINEKVATATSPSLTGPARRNPPYSVYGYTSPSELVLDQAEECLNFFQLRMLPYFPFIKLTPGTTARQLHQERPFLLQAILAVTTFSSQEKLKRVEELKHTLFASALLDAQSNIDLLLGLLTYLAWTTDPFLGRADLVSRLMMIAVSLVYDLRLFKSLPLDTKLMMSITQGGLEEDNQIISEETLQDFAEKQRAVLACFVLSSNVSGHLGRIDVLRWTPRMEEALRVTEMNTSCTTDEAFAFQVRLQLLKQRATHIREQHETDGTLMASTVATPTPSLLYLKSLRRQLHELRFAFPPTFYQRGQRRDDGLLPGYERLKYLWQSVENIKSWLDSFYVIPPSELLGLPFHFWSQMILCITVLKYLSVLEDSDWDRKEVRHTVDLISSIDRIIHKLDLCSKEPGLQCHDDLFKLLSKLLAKCRAWAESRWDLGSPVQDVESPHRNADPSAAIHNSHIQDLDQLAWIQSMDLESDQWFEEAMGLPVSL